MRRWLPLVIFAAGSFCGSLACGPGAAPAPAPKPEEEPVALPLFEDITASSGIKYDYRNGEDTANHLTILESLGGGVGLLDFDGDGLLDVFLPGGGGFEGEGKKNITGRPCRLYRNLGKGAFEDVTEKAGLAKLAGGKPWFYSHGVAVGDYDRDGWPDLLVTGWGGVALFRNTPVDPTDPRKGRRFEDATAKAGLDKGITWATSAAFADFDGDGYPDLYVCQYVDWSWDNHPPCTYDGKTPDVCPPKSFSGLPHKVFRNTGKNAFEDVSKTAGLLPGGKDSSKGLGVLVVDVDGDGKPDVYAANDTVDNFLYLNESTPGKIRFKECGLLGGAARDDRGNANGSMGVDAGDPERTGKIHIWVTNYENELHALYRNNGRVGSPAFEHRTATAGITDIGQKFVGWGTAFVDADLDGWEDIFVANGHAIRFPTGTTRSQKPVFLHNRGGKFRDASRRIGTYGDQPRLARGVAVGDLDNDGRTDLVISHVNDPVAVLRGVGGKDHHWLGVELVGANHTSTVGARVVVGVGEERQTRFAKSGGSYASSNDPRMVFGLGTGKATRATVVWPNGKTQHFDNLAVDAYNRLLQEGAKAK
jgi:hypothetical protein